MKDEAQGRVANDAAETSNIKVESGNDSIVGVVGGPFKLRRGHALSAEEREIAVKAGLAELEKGYQEIAIRTRDEAEREFLGNFLPCEIPSVDILLHGDAILPKSMSAPSRLLTLGQRMLGTRRQMLSVAVDVLYEIYKKMLERYRENGVDPRMPDSIPEFWCSLDPTIGFCRLEYCLPDELYSEVIWHLNDDSAPSEGNELFKNLKDLCKIVNRLLDLEKLEIDYATISTLAHNVQGDRPVFNN